MFIIVDIIIPALCIMGLCILVVVFIVILRVIYVAIKNGNNVETNATCNESTGVVWSRQNTHLQSQSEPTMARECIQSREIIKKIPINNLSYLKTGAKILLTSKT